MFSKYDVYTTVQSLYCYPDSDVLKNKLNIRDRNELKQAEEEITSLKQYMLMESPIKGRFTKTQLMNIHRFLFEDIYPFAGHIRREQISKGDTMFFQPYFIDQELNKVFAKLHSDKMLHETDRQCQIEHLSYIILQLIVSTTSNLMVGDNMPFNKIKCPNCQSENFSMRQDSTRKEYVYVCKDCKTMYSLEMKEILRDNSTE